MKKQGRGGPADILLPSPTGSSSVHVYHDYQKVAFKMHPGNGHATEKGSHRGREQLAAPIPDIVPNSLAMGSTVTDGAPRNSGWGVDSSSQACSGAEENSTDPHEALTESSTLTFVDAHASEESSSLHGVGVVFLKEFVLIDDDDDGDMSLREKTVTDVSAIGGAAADLVCRRLFSSSSGSASDAKVESPAPEEARPEETRTRPDKTRCCPCSIL